MSGAKVWYGGAVVAASFLLFLCEPMAAKQLLPVFGGSSAVWMVCLVFFQTALLVGYGYAHWMSRGGSGRVWVHGGLLVCAVGAAAGWAFGGLGAGIGWGGPVVRIFAALAGSVGVPFCLLGATTPLLQVWFARTERRAVPYGLFALSNGASLAALVLYPAVVEPHVTLRGQRVLWFAGVVVFAGMSGRLAWRVRGVGRLAEGVSEGVRSSARARVMWFLLPMVASVQLCAVTEYLTRNVAAIPLLWVIPLAAYLLSFVGTFEFAGMYRRWVVVRLLAVMLVSLGYLMRNPAFAVPIWLAVGLFCFELLVACVFCHGETYRLRPERADEATLFYLMVAAGGAAGSFLVGIVAPLVFDGNYDLALAFLATAAVVLAVSWDEGWVPRIGWAAGCVAAVVLVARLEARTAEHALVAVRNFYGTLEVVETVTPEGAPMRELMHGTVVHGSQVLTPERDRVPTTYYAEDAGVGVAVRNCCAGKAARIGVVGLGAGTMAAYGRAGGSVRFYEINPAVEPIARHLFTSMRQSGAVVTVATGDGRALLAGESPQGFDVLVVDAFSGDAIPLHLLTVEAMRVYQRQMAPGGVMAFHVSNQFLNLAPEVARLAEVSGLEARSVRVMEDVKKQQSESVWVLVGHADFFAQPEAMARAQGIAVPVGLRVWTDDYSSLVPVLRW